MKDLILAHDLGTSGNKASLYSAQGELIGSASASYRTTYLPDGGAEQDPQDWWRAVAASTRALLAETDKGRVGAVSFSGQMMGLVCLDREGRVLRPSMIHLDQRAAEENRLLQEKIGEDEVFRITGHRMGPGFPLQKLMWLKKHENEIYRQTWRVINAKDYIVFKMTGNCMTDFTDASSTGVFDITKREWSGKLIELAGIDGSVLPPVYPSSHVAGLLTEQAAEELGMESGVPVVLGAGDGMCSSVGCGAVRPGKSYNYIGSSSWITCIVEQPPLGEKMYLESWAHPAGPWANAGGTMQSAGACYDWAAKTLYGSASDPAIPQEMAKTRPGSGGVLFLPYLNGERVPFRNEHARGCFVGMNPSTVRADLLRSVLEGVAFNMKLIFDEAREYVIIDEMTLLGGAAASDLFAQMLADVYGVPTLTLENTGQITSLGAAVIGGVGAGLIDSFDRAEHFCRVKRRFDPDPETAAYYRERAKLLPECYGQLIDVFEKL